MAERADSAGSEHPEMPPEGSAGLSALVLVHRRSRWATGERWTARDPAGRTLDVWRLTPEEDARRRQWIELAPELVRFRHPNLVPVVAGGERDGATWIVSEADGGCPLRRLLVVATLTPEQAALITAGVLGGLRALHQAGLWHGGLDDRTVHVGETGQVRLGAWSLRGDMRDPEARRSADREAAVRLLGRLGRSTRRPGRRPADRASVILRALEACGAEAGEMAVLLDEAGQAAAAVLREPAGERAAGELAALVGMLDRDSLPRPTPAQVPVPAAPPPPRHALRSPAAVWAPAPHPARWVAGGLALLVIVAAAGALLVAARNPHSAAVAIVPRPGRSASPPPGTGLRAPTPSPLPTGPRQVPTLAPAAAGPITGIEIQPLEGSCQPNATCPVQVTVRLAPQPSAEQVTWSFHVFDRCTGTTNVLPGTSVTALAGWAYVYGTSWPELSAGHLLALVAVTESPAAAASPAVLAGGSSPC